MFPQEIYQSCVSPLSRWVSLFSQPYPSGYLFPLPFGWWLSLLKTSYSRWRILYSLRFTYLFKQDSIGFTTFCIINARLARVYLLTPGLSVSEHNPTREIMSLERSTEETFPNPVHRYITISPMFVRDEAHDIHFRSPVQSFPCPIVLWWLEFLLGFHSSSTKDNYSSSMWKVGTGFGH